MEVGNESESTFYKMFHSRSPTESNKSKIFQISTESNKSLLFQASTESSKGIESTEFEEWAVLDIVDIEVPGITDSSNCDLSINDDIDDYDNDNGDDCVKYDDEEMDPLRVVLLESMEYKFADGVRVQVEKSQGDGHTPLVQKRSVDEENLMTDNMSKSLQKERQLLQEKMYTSWLNYRLLQVPGSPQIVNLFEDLRNGKYLLALLEDLTGKTLKVVKGEMRVHHLNNLALVFKVLTELNIKLVGIHNENICDGHITSTLGLCWSIIYHFQVLQSVDNTAGKGNAEKALLEWCRDIAKCYASSDVKSFQPTRWKSGYMLNAIIHSFNPKLFQYHSLTQFSDAGRVQHALDLAYNHYQVPQLFSATDFENNLMDNKTLVLYVSMLREKMNLDKDKDNKENEVYTRLQGELENLKKIVENKEICDLVNPPSNLSFPESKKFSGQYKEFENELDELSSKVEKIKEEVKSADSTSKENIDQFNAECEELQNRVNALKEKGKACHEDVKERRINVVKDKLVNVTTNVATIKDEMEKLSEKITPDASKGVLEKCESLCKDMLQQLAQMQSMVKGTCALVDEAYADKLLLKDIRQQLKNEAINVLDEYAKLMVALEVQQKKANTLHGNKVKNTEEKFSNWSDKVKELDVWLSKRIDKFENMLIKYGSSLHLKEVAAQNKQLTKEIGESWKTFEGIALEWNTELCDELNDDKYADVLTDIQAKFNKLNEVATGTKTLISGMINQKRAEDDLCAELQRWKAYADSKQIEIDVDIDVVNSEKLHTQIEAILKEIDEKDNDVKSFLESSNHTLQKNKYDENTILQIELDLKVFCDKWDQLKATCKERKQRAEHLTQTQIIQRESERNLVESLIDWQKILDDYTLRLNNCDISESCDIHEINMAIEQVEALIADVDGHDGKLKEYDRNSTTLINTLEHDNAARLNVDFQLFFKHWEDLLERCHLVLSCLKEQVAKLHSNEQSIMGEWKVKDMVTEEWLDNVNQEIIVYAEPDSNIDDIEDYFSKFDELEAKFNAQGELVEGSIMEGTHLVESDKLMLDENKEKIRGAVDAFKQKKSTLQETLLAAKKKLHGLMEKQNMQKANEQKLTDDLSEWKNILEDNTDTLGRCDINEICNISDTQKAVDILEALLAEISTNDEKLIEFDRNSQELLNTLAPEKAAHLNMDFKLFFKSWDHCKDRTTERLSGLKMQLGQHQKNEDYLIGEWSSNALKTLAWLEDVNKESALYCTVPDDQLDIQAFISNFEELQNKVIAKVDSITEQKEHGNVLIESGKIQHKENMEKIQNDVSTFDEKESCVQANLSNARKFMVALNQRLITQQESERNLRDSLLDWQKVLDGYINRLDKCNVNNNSLIQDIQTAIQQLEDLLEEISGNDQKLNEYNTNSQILFNTLDAEQVANINTSFKLFFNNWSDCKGNIIERLHGLQRQHDEQLKHEEDIMVEWESNASQTHAWLDVAINDSLSFYNLPGTSVNIESLLADFEELQTRVSDEKIVNEQIRDGTSLVAGNKLKLVENKEKVQNDLTNFTQKRSALQMNLLTAQKFLAGLNKQNAKEDELKHKLLLLKKYLEKKKGEFNDLSDETVQIAMTKVTLLLDQFNVKHGEVEPFLKSCIEVVTSNKHNKDNAAIILSDVNTFSTEWEEFKDMLQAKLLSMEMQLDEHHKNECNLMAEWETNAHRTRTWLDEAINDSLSYCEHPGKLVSIESLLSNFEELNTRVSANEDFVTEQIRHGTSLIAGEELKLAQNKEKVQKDLTLFTQNNSTLQVNLLNAQKFLAGLNKQSANEVELNLNLHTLKKFLEEKKGEFNGLSDETLNVATTKVTVMLDEFNVKNDEVESLQHFSIEVVSSSKHKKEDAAKVLSDVNTFSKEWSEFKDILQTKLSSLAGIEVQDAKENELKSKLSELKKYLKLQKDELSDIPNAVLQDTLSKVTILLDTIEAKNDEVDSLQIFSIEVISGNKHNKGEATKLLSDVNAFSKEWNTFKDMLHSRLSRLQEKVEEENKTEGKIMEDWKAMSEQISDWLDKAENEIALYTEEDPTDDLQEFASNTTVDLMMYQMSSTKFHINESVEKGLIEKLNEEEKAITEQLKYGSSLVESDNLKSEESRESIQKDIIMYTHRKSILDDKLLQAKKLLDDMAFQNLKDNEIKHTISVWKKYLEGKNETFNEVNKQNDIHVAIQQLEVILAEVILKDNDVELFVKTSDDILTNNKYKKERSAGIQADLSRFFIEWNNFMDATQNSKDRLQERIDSARESEKLAMDKWKGKIQEVEEWLMTAEEESDLYTQPPNDFEALEDFSSNFENLISKLTTEEMTVDEKLQYSTELADSDKLFDKNRETIRKAVSTLTNRKLVLNGNLLNAQKWLASAREKLNSAETEGLMNWFTEANAVKETLRAYETVGREEVIKTVKEGEQALERQKGLMDELVEHQATIDDLLRRGGELLANKKWGQAKNNELMHEMKIVEQRWRALKDRIGDVLDGYKNILTALRAASEEKVHSLLTRVNSFNDWLLFAKQQLHGGRKASTFAEYIQRESGLKKLSTDLESRAAEFDYLVKILLDLTPEKVGELTPKDNELVLATEKLNSEWDTLIDSIDVEFKNLYEAINCLLDTRRGQIEKSIKLMKNNLSEIDICSNDRKEMSFSAQKLAELNNELPKLKGNVGKLMQQTSTLNDVTVFMDNEKEKQILIQSTDDLVVEYDQCVQQTSEATKGFRACIVDYFKVQCEEAKKKLNDYRNEIPVYNTDEEDLTVLKEYLIQDQQVMNDVKSEHLLIDDLEQFAEEISLNGVLTNEDQVVIAEAINEVLKAFDQLRNQCKEGTNRVYAVTMHIFNHHLHSISEELEAVKKKVNRIMKEKSNITDFDRAIEGLLFAQKLRNKVEDISSQIALVTEKINKWIEANIIELADVNKLKEKDTYVVKESTNLTKDIDILINRIEDQVRKIVLQKFEDFWAWLPTVQKRSEEGDEIGPDFETVNKQIQEMKVIEGQALQMSFSGLLDDDKSCVIFEFLTEEDKGNLKLANDEWTTIKNWVDKRLETLQRSEDVWEDFKARKVDLVDYLRDIENELTAASGLDLNDTVTVEARKDAFKAVTAGMETRKYHVANLVETADELIALITSDTKTESESTLPSSIRSQVTDILDSWNSMVKRSIELKTVLQACSKKFETLQIVFSEVHDWVSSVQDILNQFTVDACGEHINELRISLEEKQQQEEEMKKKLDEVNEIDSELAKNGEICSQYTLDGNITELNEDFTAASNQLEELRKFRGKVRILSRRVRGGTRHFFTGVHDRTKEVVFKKPIESAS